MKNMKIILNIVTIMMIVMMIIDMMVLILNDYYDYDDAGDNHSCDEQRRQAMKQC